MKHPASLDAYQSKCDFDRTPEPRGAPGKENGPLTFTVQRHEARHLQLDFRLELGGVLKSWAVPKGISPDPKARRLAIRVEDHPLSHGNFEGTIPEGQHGAGTVLVWDRGVWMPEGDPVRAYESGKLLFTLKGERLTGRWSLVRFRTSEKRSENEYWLLRKASRADARRRSRRRSSSARSSAGLTEGRRKAAARPVVPGAVPSPFTLNLRPQLATLVAAAPPGDGWLHEIKLDGYRIFAVLNRGTIRLLTRNGRDWTAKLKTITEELSSLPLRSAVLDGEVVALTPRGTSSFEDLKDALDQGDESVLFLYFFDLLYLDGMDLRPAALIERKAALARLLRAARNAPHLRYSEHVQGNGDLFYRHSCELALEGIISKRKDSPYREGRGLDWLKVKCLKRQEFVIGGYAAPQDGREGLISLLLGVHRGGDLIYVGRAVDGLNPEILRDLKPRLESAQRADSPFREPLPPLETRDVHWTEPTLVAEVSFLEWTAEHRLRHPTFLGLREGQPAAGALLEWPKSPPEPESLLTHPDRVLYREDGITKRDLARYYGAVAPWILPHVRGRLLSILRCPQGASKPGYYQKRRVGSLPEAIKAVSFHERHKVDMGFYIDDEAGLQALVQAGALEIHPWGSRLADLEHPDRCTFNLDPGPHVPWKDVVRTAHELGDFLAGWGLESFVKTTGGKGLHIVMPLSDAPEWGTLKIFAKRIAEEFARRHPDRYVTVMSRKDRTGTIFIDYLRNDRGGTTLAPYSSRSLPRATVAVPLSWEELTPSLRSDAFTIKTLPSRMSRLSADPWGRMFEVKQSIRGRS